MTINAEASSEYAYRREGYCPICEATVEFSARYDWYRDHLYCSGCASVPRERALALVLSRRFPDWRGLAIHEASPNARGISSKLGRECNAYTASTYRRDEPLGKQMNGGQNENLEVQTFDDESFDLVISLDVMERINEPAEAMQEIERTLRRGGSYIFTTPTHKNRPVSERKARRNPDGTVEQLASTDKESSSDEPVMFEYGYDLAELIAKWSGMDVEVVRFHDHHHGIIGEFTEVYVATKSAAITSIAKHAQSGEFAVEDAGES
jgi:SAM-dependent methyltransferase